MISSDAGVHAANRAQVAALLHLPYVFAGEKLSGMDCSGLAKFAWELVLELPHKAAAQAVLLDAVPATDAAWAQARPGDLVFYQGAGGITRSSVGHVGVLLGLWHSDGVASLRAIAQATGTAQGSEIIKATKYEAPLFLGYVR